MKIRVARTFKYMSVGLNQVFTGVIWFRLSTSWVVQMPKTGRQ